MTGGKVDQKAEMASPLCPHAPSQDFILDNDVLMAEKRRLGLTGRPGGIDDQGRCARLDGGIGLFKLPGDLQFGSKNWRVFLPLTSCLIISIVLTLLLWLISYLRR